MAGRDHREGIDYFGSSSLFTLMAALMISGDS